LIIKRKYYYRKHSVFTELHKAWKKLNKFIYKPHISPGAAAGEGRQWGRKVEEEIGQGNTGMQKEWERERGEEWGRRKDVWRCEEWKLNGDKRNGIEESGVRQDCVVRRSNYITRLQRHLGTYFSVE